MNQRTSISTLVLVAALSTPGLASAKLSKELRAELQGYIEPLKGESDTVARQATFLTRAILEGKAANADFEAATKDEDKRVRVAAGLAWYLNGDKKALEFVRAELASDASLLDTLQELVAVLPDKTEAKLIGEVWKSATPDIKATLARYMATQHGPVFDLLAQAITEKNEADRNLAIEAVVFQANKDAVAPLEKLLMGKDAKARLGAAKAFVTMSRIRPLEADARRVLGGLLSDKDDAVKAVAAQRLLELRDPAAVKAAFDLIRSAKESPVRQEWLGYLLASGQRVSMTVVEPYLNADDAQEKLLAFQLAASTKDSEFLAKLLKMETSTEFDERMLAIESLGYTGSTTVVPVLSRTLFEGRVDVRLASARGLERLGAADSFPALEKALRGERDPKVKLTVIDALGAIKTTKSLQALRFLVTNSDLEIKTHTLMAIRRIGLPEGAQALEVLFRDRNTDIQWLAFLTAIEIKPDVGMRNIKGALRNPPDSYIDDIAAIKGDNAKKQVFEYLLTQTTGSTQSDAIRYALKQGGFTEILRKLALDPNVSVGDRRVLLLAFANDGGPAEKAVLERAVRTKDSKQLSELAAWLLVRNPTSDLEPSFRGYLGQKNVGVKSLALYGIAAAND